jgi:hypothetical protein
MIRVGAFALCGHCDQRCDRPAMCRFCRAYNIGILHRVILKDYTA